MNNKISGFVDRGKAMLPGTEASQRKKLINEIKNRVENDASSGKKITKKEAKNIALIIDRESSTSQARGVEKFDLEILQHLPKDKLQMIVEAAKDNRLAILSTATDVNENGLKVLVAGENTELGKLYKDAQTIGGEENEKGSKVGIIGKSFINLGPQLTTKDAEEKKADSSKDVGDTVTSTTIGKDESKTNKNGKIAGQIIGFVKSILGIKLEHILDQESKTKEGSRVINEKRWAEGFQKIKKFSEKHELLGEVVQGALGKAEVLRDKIKSVDLSWQAVKRTTIPKGLVNKVNNHHPQFNLEFAKSAWSRIKAKISNRRKIS